MSKELGKAALNAMFKVYSLLEEALKSAPTDCTIAFSQQILTDPDDIDHSPVSGGILHANGIIGKEIPHDFWTIFCAYKEVLHASKNEGMPLKMIGTVFKKQPDGIWQKELKIQTVDEYNKIEEMLKKIDKDIKQVLHEEIIKSKVEWISTSFYMLPKYQHITINNKKERIENIPTEKILQIGMKAIEIYKSFDHEIAMLYWTLRTKKAPDDFERTDSYI